MQGPIIDSFIRFKIIYLVLYKKIAQIINFDPISHPKIQSQLFNELIIHKAKAISINFMMF